MDTTLSWARVQNERNPNTRKLIVIPGYCDGLGGMLISLSSLVLGFERIGMADHIQVLVRTGTLMERHFTEIGLHHCITSIAAESQAQFIQLALQSVNQYPQDWPLLLDNCVWREFIKIITLAAPRLRISGRPVYHFCHDLALSHNYLGYLARKVMFTALDPQMICNSNFTANHIRRFSSKVCGILYQPVDLQRFNDMSAAEPPAALQAMLASGARVMLTPSRLNKPGIINDKNLQALIPVLAQLKQKGHFYHGVVIGEDKSPGRVHTQELLNLAKAAGVDDRFTILPPTFEIENYYRHADVVVTLAPREPFGRIVVEAIACGVPVVGCRTGGVGEILQHFAPQWMTDSDHPERVAETILRVADAPDTPLLLARGQSWVRTRCSVEGYAQGMVELTHLGVTTTSPNHSNPIYDTALH